MASIRKRKRAKGPVWIVDYRDPAGRRRWATCATRDEAEQVRADKVTASRWATPTPADPHVTFGDYGRQCLARLQPDLAPSTHRGYSTIFVHHLEPAFGALKVRALADLGRLKTLLADKREAGYSKNMVRLIRATLSVILGDAVEDGLLAVNPVAQLAKRRGRRAGTVTQAERRRTIRPLAPEQFEAASATAARHERRIAPYILTLERGGFRPSEGLGLHWDDLDFGAREIHVQRSLGSDGDEADTKTRTTRVVDMSAGLAHVLQRLHVERKAEALKRGWPTVPKWVFCSEAGTPLDLSNVTKAWRRVLKKANLPAFRLYDLRHTYATTLLARGAPITYVAAQLGHTTPATTLRYYAHWIPTRDTRWVDLLDGVPAAGRERARASLEAPGSQPVANSRNLDRSGGLSGWNHWSRRPDLNRGPVDYESTALPTELRRPRVRTLPHLRRLFFAIAGGSGLHAGAARWRVQNAPPCPGVPGCAGQSSKVRAKWRGAHQSVWSCSLPP